MQNSNNTANGGIAVFGLGFVGLPLALSFAMRGCRVTGVDINEALVEEINSGITHHQESYQGKSIREILREQLETGRFSATTDSGRAMRECTNIIITVGLPVHEGRPESGPLEECARAVAAGLKRHDLVVVRSTLVPGYTRELLLPLLESGGLRAGRDFYLAYASERIAEGRAFEEFEQMPGLVSGFDGESLKRARDLLGIVTKAPLVEASSFEVVELAKLMENISRDVNIAMVNEFARFSKAMGLNIFEVIELANTHKRVNLLTPGPGVGGYCIPNALHYLTPKAEELGVTLPLLATARSVNEDMPAYVASMVHRRLPVPASEARVGVLGVAMKDYSSDARCSPALKIIWLLERSGVEVRAFDPAVPERYPFSVDSLEEAVRGAHGLLVLARQEGIAFENWQLFSQLMSRDGQPFIVDTKRVYGGGSFEREGIQVESL